MFGLFKKKPLTPFVEKIIDELRHSEKWSVLRLYSEALCNNTLRSGDFTIDFDDYKVRGGFRICALRVDGKKVLSLSVRDEVELSAAAGTRLRKLIRKQQNELHADLLEKYEEQPNE